MHKIILDTDVGDDLDDALALAYALMCGEIELLGVTTVFRDTVRRAELACCLLEALGRSDVGVYAGLGKPLLDSVAVNRPINRLYFELIRLWGGDNPEPRPLLHDPLAVAMVFDPTFCETRPMRIEVETRSERLNGATVPARARDAEPNADVCVAVDAQRFLDHFTGTLTS